MVKKDYRNDNEVIFLKHQLKTKEYKLEITLLENKLLKKQTVRKKIQLKIILKKFNTSKPNKNR